ncbi:MAG: hypothetical protein V4544_02575 [Pseudomonadota bacterium]
MSLDGNDFPATPETTPRPNYTSGDENIRKEDVVAKNYNISSENNQKSLTRPFGYETS